MQMEEHIKAKHPNNPENRGPSAAADASYRLFLEATKRIIVPESVDNRSSVLHPVRTFPGILDHKVGAKTTPLFQPLVYCQIDMSNVGVIIRNFKVVRILHNRTGLELKLQMLYVAMS